MEIYKLNNETIDMLSEKIGEMYKNAGCTKKEILRAKLLLEEALIKYKSRLGEDIDLYFRTYKIFGQFRFLVRIRAQSFDPFTLEENPMAFMIKSIMSTFENGMPSWKYRNLENEILFTVRKKSTVGNLSKIAISIAAAIILGVIARIVFNSQSLINFVDDYVDPISNAYAGLFCVMAALLTFFSMVLSVVHIGDMASVGAIGGRMMRRFFTVSGIATIALTIPILPVLTFSGAGEYKLAAKSVYDILVGFIPTNIVSPFLDFNSIHIMIIGAMFGFSLLVMGQKGGTLTQVFEECNLVAVYTNGFLNKFIAIYVAFKAFSIVSASKFSQLKSAGKMVAVIVAAEVLLMAFYAAYTCIKKKITFHTFIKTVMPTFLICLSSANFGAAFSTLVDALFDSGVDGDTVKLSINLGSVFFRPGSTIMFVVSSLFIASAYDVEISVVWLVLAVLLSLVLASSMPNIPGASVSVLTILYSQLGIPSSGLSFMIAITAVLQFLTVAVDTFCLQSETLCMKKIEA